MLSLSGCSVLIPSLLSGSRRPPFARLGAQNRNEPRFSFQDRRRRRNLHLLCFQQNLDIFDDICVCETFVGLFSKNTICRSNIRRHSKTTDVTKSRYGCNFQNMASTMNQCWLITYRLSQKKSTINNDNNNNDNIDNNDIKISIRVFFCVCFISIYWMQYGLHCGRQVHCGRQGQQGQDQGGG